VKKLNEEYPTELGGKTVEMVSFDKDGTERLELVKRYLGLKQNKEVFKALVYEKCDAIKRSQEAALKRQGEENRAMEWLEKGEYTCPM
jgi:hypothetical protein